MTIFVMMKAQWGSDACSSIRVRIQIQYPQITTRHMMEKPLELLIYPLMRSRPDDECIAGLCLLFGSEVAQGPKLGMSNSAI